MGRDAQRRARLLALGAVGADLPRERDHAACSGLQPSRRRFARRARSEIARVALSRFGGASVEVVARGSQMTFSRRISRGHVLASLTAGVSLGVSMRARASADEAYP